MKGLIIKIGKAIQDLKRDGFLNGSKKIINSLKLYRKLMKKLPGGDVLFITNGVGDSALYRSHHVSEELNLNGFKSFVSIADSPYLLGYADSFKIFVFQKVSYNSKIKNLIDKIKSLNKEIIFEIDDLVFDSSYFNRIDFLENINSFEKKQYEKGIGEEILKDPYVKVCTTTTSYLADKLREYPARNAAYSDAGGNKKVFIVPNKLSQSDIEICEKIVESKVHKVEKSIKLGYFSGTISHNKDFAVITDVLFQIMEKYSQVKLFLAGPLDIENKLNKFKDRIKQPPYVPRKKHFENIASVDINLAPLEIGNPFCEARSELKFFEAGIVGVPTIASATQTFKEAISDGFDGFVASNTEEWFSKLERLILSPELRLGIGQKARQKALEQYSTQNAKNEEYYACLRSKIK
ncbi:MAG: glycosyltransferase [Patescibacteria group bacterium]